MRRFRLISVLLVFSVVLLVAAPSALATAHGGQGWYGQTNDKTITQTMFIVIAFFPAVIIVLSVIQWALDKRRHARWDAQKRRAASADWRGGW